ncbi:unnamed protein product [Periconia digitata]|uniref:Zn(2)-C6 fungal-type domain-containing protein n=1 Tax=Periconia digitata TaxID=1303443 RepID=A0A9W4U5I3_9PLEO|nr:unnamed protein product [Periconia digitata]
MQQQLTIRPAARNTKTRRKKVCLTCQRRKKKCVGSTPRCETCRLGDWRCEWGPKNSSLAPTREKQQLASRKAPTPAPLLSVQNGLACELTPDSFQLLQYYTNVTGVLLQDFPQTTSLNPFVDVILPVAYDDDLLMHTLLAISGTHLSYSYKVAGVSPFAYATYKHYAHVLRELQRDVDTLVRRDVSHVVRLLVLLNFLAIYEVYSGSPYAALIVHLRGLTQLFCQLRTEVHDISSLPEETRDLASYAYENFNYLTLSNLFIPYPHQSDLVDLLSLASSGLTMDHEPVTAMLRADKVLLASIPRACALFVRRIAEQSAGEIKPTAAFMTEYTDLSSTIESWDASIAIIELDEDTATNPSYTSHKSKTYLVSRLLQHGLRIYILTAFMGNLPIPSPAIEDAIELEVEALANVHRILAKQGWNVATWAHLAAVTCFRTDALREEFVALMKTSNHARHFGLIREALELLWKEQKHDPKAFGPYGLMRILEKYNMSFCLS